MSDRQFVYLRRNGQPSGSQSIGHLLAFARARILVSLGPFILKQDEETIGTDLDRGRVIERLTHRLEVGDVGPTYRVRGRRGVVFGAREVVPPVRVIDTNGNHASDLYWSTIVATFPQYHPRFAGSYVCKDIAGSSTLSQHSYGNAVDVFFDTSAHQEAVANWVVAHADDVKAEHVISLRRIWTRGVGWHPYTGETHYHLHVDFFPNYSGPCGVRG